MLKNSTKWKKLMKYTKNIQNNPKFEKGVSNNVGWLQKKEAKNKKQKKFFPECLTLALGEETLPRVPGTWALGKGLPAQN
jgi:hypothetical protein